jgi:hypothetical protein
MRRTILKLAIAASVCGAVTLGMMQPASAIPVFARKYGFTCSMCHSNFPRLNDFGMRYRQNGYQIPGRENEEKTVLEGPAPFAMRTSAGYNSDKFKNEADATDINQFQLNGLDILSGGLFGENIGYFLVYPPKIEESRGVVGQPGELEMASVVFSHVGKRPFNIRLGRFEPAYTAFSVKRQLSVSPYDIYDFTFLGGPAFSETQEGIELTGYSPCGFSWATGWINGSATNLSSDSPADFYVRLAKVFGPGEGQTAGQRLGLIGYWGRARPYSARHRAPPRPEERESFRRIGLDGSFNYKQLNLGVQLLWCRDNAALWSTTSAYDYSGGFAELSYMPTDSFVFFVRRDWVNTPTWRPPGWFEQDIRRWTFGGRYYFEHNLALHIEYSHRSRDLMPGVGPTEASENLFTIRLDFAF